MDIIQRLDNLRNLLGIDEKQKRAAEIEQEMSVADFWSDNEKASALNKELTGLKNEVDRFQNLYELAEIATEEEAKDLIPELLELETLSYFDGKYDNHNVIMNFYAGAGGVDAQDWTEMLLRMYLKWADPTSPDGLRGTRARVLEQTKGAEAGIKNASIEIEMPYAYGKLKYESGVHRLVRQSPFNAKGLRQTSFALVEVMPAIESAKEVEIEDKDLRIDTFHASGHGGQSVNTTNSAIRITHLPTGIVATCQNERSQLQNKETALKMIRSRLAQLMLEQHKDKVDEIRGTLASPEWGNQIRSYVIHPYKLVKDHRTEHESAEPDKVLDGEIEGFLEAEVRTLIPKK